MKTTNPIIIGLALLSILVSGFLFYKISALENQNRELLQRLYESGGRGNSKRQNDPYIARQVKNTILKHRKEILSCYTEFLRNAKNPAQGKKSNKKTENTSVKKEGKITLDFQIDEDGNPLRPEIVSAEIGDGNFHKCLTDTIAKLKFPPPPYGHKKYVVHTFRFADKK